MQPSAADALAQSVSEITAGWTAAQGVDPSTLAAARLALARSSIVAGPEVALRLPPTTTGTALAMPALTTELRQLAEQALGAGASTTVAVVRSPALADRANPTGVPPGPAAAKSSTATDPSWTLPAACTGWTCCRSRSPVRSDSRVPLRLSGWCRSGSHFFPWRATSSSWVRAVSGSWQACWARRSRQEHSAGLKARCRPGGEHQLIGEFRPDVRYCYQVLRGRPVGTEVPSAGGRLSP
jgi:hypothetical protein